MGLFQENTSLLYLSILIVPVLSIVLSKNGVSLPRLFALTTSTQFSIAATVSLFCGTAFSVLLIIMPFIHDSFFGVVIALAIMVGLLSISRYNKKFSAAAASFIGRVNPSLRIVASVLIIGFLAIIHMTALIFFGSVLVGHFFEGSLYLFVVVNVVVAGFVVLIGDRMTMLVNNAMLGFLSLVTLIALLLIPEAVSLLGSILMSAFKDHYGMFFVGAHYGLFFVYAPVGLILLLGWVWWIDQYVPQPQWSEEKDMAMNSVTTFLLFATIAALLLILSGSLKRENVPLMAAESPVFALPVLFLLSFLFFGSLFRSFSMVKMFSSQISTWLSSNGTTGEKDILVGRLAVAAFTIVSILLFPAAKIFGGRIIELNLAVVACFVVPLTSVFFLSVLWRRLSQAGISAGILSGLFLGGVMFVAVLPAFSWNISRGLDPALMSVISFAVTIATAIAATFVSEQKEQRWRKLPIVSTGDTVNKIP